MRCRGERPVHACDKRFLAIRSSNCIQNTIDSRACTSMNSVGWERINAQESDSIASRRRDHGAYRAPFPSGPRSHERARTGCSRAMDRPMIDHRGPEFARLGRAVLEGCKAVFQTEGPVVIYPSSGTGAWEAAIVNTLSPGDRVLMAETGHFATLWQQDGAELRPRRRLPAGRLAARRESGGDRGATRGRPAAFDQGGDGGAQRDLDRRRQPHRRDPPGDRRGPASRAADGRRDLVARLASTSATTNGASTSRSRARRRG